jgi:hypothetical protein
MKQQPFSIYCEKFPLGARRRKKDAESESSHVEGNLTFEVDHEAPYMPTMREPVRHQGCVQLAV